MMFGTFRNPKGYEMDTGFYDGASARIVDMLLCRDVSEEKQTSTESTPANNTAQA